MIRCVMFDFGNVLVHFDTQRFYDFLKARQYQIPRPRNPGEIFATETIADFDLGRITTTQMFERVKAELALNVGVSEFLIQYCEVMRPDPKMPILRRILKDNGIRIVVVSNINVHHFHYVQMTYPDVFAGFDYLMLSFQHGLKKPDPEMWIRPMEALGVKAEECFFIDDLVSNITAFEELGGVGHHYDVVDEKFCPNGRLEIERNKLLLKMVNWGMLTLNQAGGIARVDFSN